MQHAEKIVDPSEISLDDLVLLCAEDSELYCRTFFPKTVRQPFAAFHTDAWQKMESNNRLVNLLMFRGSGKTSHGRLYTSKNIAYGISRTILYTSKSEGHAIRSTSWIKKAVEFNTLWAESFQIRPGSKWQDVEFEIIVGPEEIPIWVMATGVLGTVRGVNRDDYRPDLIVLDDVLDDENAHTPEQRNKMERLVYGALMESLAPTSDAPHAKMVSLNTPQDKEDFAVKALKDESWLSAVYGCWTKETAELPVEYQESAWPERLTSIELRKEKHAAAARNTLSTFQREKECKLSSPETSSFRVPWLKKYGVAPEGMTCVYAIDPVPPPSEATIAKGLFKTDFEAHVVWGALGDRRFLLDYKLMRGHEPTWSISTFFEMQRKWRPMATLVETVAYQRVLHWLLKKAMEQQRQWYPIEEYTSRESKFNRIVSTHNGPASAGRLYVKNDQVEFLEAFGTYPAVSSDDLLDASAIALRKLEGLFIKEDGSLRGINEGPDENYKPLEIRTCP